MKTKYEEPRVMRELHEIRARHYEETKHMTLTDRPLSVLTSKYEVEASRGRFGSIKRQKMLSTDGGDQGDRSAEAHRQSPVKPGEQPTRL
jgi:hypothetical protein